MRTRLRTRKREERETQAKSYKDTAEPPVFTSSLRSPRVRANPQMGRVLIVEAMGLCSPEPAGPNVHLGKRRVSRSKPGPPGPGTGRNRAGS